MVESMNKAQFETKLGSGIHTILEHFSCVMPGGGEGIPHRDFNELREAMAKTAKAAMIEWLCTHEETDYCPLEGDEYKCYLVPVSAVQELER